VTLHGFSQSSEQQGIYTPTPVTPSVSHEQLQRIFSGEDINNVLSADDINRLTSSSQFQELASSSEVKKAMAEANSGKTISGSEIMDLLSSEQFQNLIPEAYKKVIEDAGGVEKMLQQTEQRRRKVMDNL
jgi:hypothetical protein